MRLQDWLVLLVIFAVVGAACAPAEGSASTPTPDQPRIPTTAPELTVVVQPSPVGTRIPASPTSGGAMDQPGSDSTAVPPGDNAAVENAKQDLASRTGVGASEIRVLSVESVEWPDASLGCPKPGMMYAQVITPGYRIELEVGGKTYEYHTDQRGQVVLCEQ